MIKLGDLGGAVDNSGKLNLKGSNSQIGLADLNSRLIQTLASSNLGKQVKCDFTKTSHTVKTKEV